MAGKNKLDLHEAMLLILLERKHTSGNGAGIAREISKEIGERDLYRQKGDRIAPGNIIRRRAEIYSALFDSEGSGQNAVVSLKELPRELT